MENSIEITENAQKHIAKIVKDDNATYFRITVLGGGCAGFQYLFDFENMFIYDNYDNLSYSEQVDFEEKLRTYIFKLKNTIPLYLDSSFEKNR